MGCVCVCVCGTDVWCVCCVCMVLMCCVCVCGVCVCVVLMCGVCVCVCVCVYGTDVLCVCVWCVCVYMVLMCGVCFRSSAGSLRCLRRCSSSFFLSSMRLWVCLCLVCLWPWCRSFRRSSAQTLIYLSATGESDAQV